MTSEEYKVALAEALRKLVGIMPVGAEWCRAIGKGAPKGGIAYLGQSVTRAMYSDLWDYVQTELADSLIEESEWQTLFTSQNGNVPYYSKGDGSTTFRMPCISGYIKGAKGVSEVGQYTPEGLPNITGHVRAYSSFNQGNASFATQGVSGAFYWQTEWDTDSSKALATSQNVTSGTADTIRNVPFDASRSNSIYGNSTHVTPETVTVLFGVYAIGTVVSIGEATEEGILAELSHLGSSAVMVDGNQVINGNKRFTDATFDDHFSMYDGTTKRTVMTMKYDGSTYGSDLMIGAGSNIFVGSGESHTGMYNIIGAANSDETTYICSDNDIVFYTNCQTPTEAKKFVLGKDGSGLGKAYITATYQSGTSWYRKWSDGWIEQGGYTAVSHSTSGQVKNLVTPFTTTNYVILSAVYGNAKFNDNVNLTARTTTTFTIAAGTESSGGNAPNGANWYACGK